jgi:hypothetical protein
MTRATAARRANKALTKLTTNAYFEHVPLDKLYGAIEAAGFEIPTDERPFIVCGHEGRASVPLLHMDHDEALRRDAVERLGGESAKYTIGTASALTFTWYRMPSGRFEVVAYVA